MDKNHQNWNFHGYIAVPLEIKARNIFGFSDKSVRKGIFAADSIENGSFVKATIAVLRKLAEDKSDYEIDEFEKAYSEYIGKGKLDIGKENAIKIYDDFEKLEEKFTK